jgi:hypothetical protein
MNIKEQLKKWRNALIHKVGSNAAKNPTISFAEIGKLFGVNGRWVSRAARVVGQMPRRRGRKKASAGKKVQVR